LKVSANVKIAIQCFEIFGWGVADAPNAPPLVAPACEWTLSCCERKGLCST